MNPKFFPTQAHWRRWLEEHHADKDELWVGFYKTGTGRPSITWPQSVDEALCFGWIDGVRKSIDAERYMIRFTKRRATSIWSAVNIKRMAFLEENGLVNEAGRLAFKGRKAGRSGIYAYENRHKAALTPAMRRTFQANAKAWKFFSAQAPWYRRTVTWYIISAKKEETRERRLAKVIAASAAGRSIDPLLDAKLRRSR